MEQDHFKMRMRYCATLLLCCTRWINTIFHHFQMNSSREYSMIFQLLIVNQSEMPMQQPQGSMTLRVSMVTEFVFTDTSQDVDWMEKK